jgi:glutamate--cysteine ligase
MSAPSHSGGVTLTDKRQLIEYLAAGAKPPEDWRIGTEHEKFVFRRKDLTRVPYDGPGGILALLHGLMRFGWELVHDADKVVGLAQNNAGISLEPGGQFELSGAPLKTLHETCAELHQHLRQVREVAGEFNLGMLGMGFDPLSTRAEVPWMPKRRYAIMRDYMPKKGKLGLDMMLRTCTVQVNLDFASEADMVAKFRVGLALQPIAVALFANSPFTEGKPNGFLSYRSQVWTDTDPDRCGILPFVFEPGMGFERYVDYMLDVPMYFVYRNGNYTDVAGQSFRDFMKGKLPGMPGAMPVMSDWVDHLTTVFPEVRLKQFLEMRGADGGPWRRLCALPAFWTGLLYDRAALDQASQLIAGWTQEDHAAMRRDVPKQGLKTKFRGRTLKDWALDVLNISAAGLKTRAQLDQTRDDESIFLDTLFESAQSGLTPAELLLAEYRGRWGGQIAPLYEEQAY